jgi:hypothetical protein
MGPIDMLEGRTSCGPDPGTLFEEEGHIVPLASLQDWPYPGMRHRTVVATTFAADDYPGYAREVEGDQRF